MRLSLALVALLLVPTALRAEPLTTAAAPDWSIGTGVGLYSRLPLGQLSTTTPLALAFAAERRLTGNLWLGLQLDGAYQSDSTETPSQDAASATTEKSTSLLSAALGGRYVFNPGGVVELSGVLTLGFGYRSSSTKQLTPSAGLGLHSTETDTSGYSLGTDLGIAFERKLGKNLALRFSTTIASLAYAGNTSEQENSTNPGVIHEEEGSGLIAGFSFQPQIALHLQF